MQIIEHTLFSRKYISFS